MKTDGELAREAQSGSRDAFTELLRRHEVTLRSIARAKLGNAESAREVAQEAVYRAFVSIGSLRDSDQVRAWLGRIVANLCTDALRRRVLEERRPAPEGRPTTLFDESLLESLEPLQRQLIVLRFVNDLSYQEMADWLDVPLNQVKWELHKAFEMLRSRVKS